MLLIITRFQISVHNSLVMDVGNSIQNASHYRAGFLVRELLVLVVPLFDEVREPAVVD